MIASAAHNPLQELIKDLHALGFSDYEAKAYVALLKLQPATAYEVSKEAGLPKANAYTVLESLSKKDAVQPVSESPVRYMAASPDVLFDRIAETTEQRCRRVRESLRTLSTGAEHEYVWSLKGGEAVGARIGQMIEEARQHLWIKAAAPNLRPYREALQRASGRGVEVLIVLFGDDPQEFELGGKGKTWLHEGNGIPVGIAPYLVTMTRDYDEALVVEMREEACGSYTRNRALVNLADSLIRHEVYFAEIFEVFGTEIQERFGHALYGLRRKYLPAAQVEALRVRLGDLVDKPASAA